MASPLHGVRIVVSSSDEKEFLNFPYNLYEGDSNWVAPLRLMQKDILSRKKNPFYKNADMALFLADLDGKPAGRIAAIKNNSYNSHTGENAGFFGFFDCIDNQKTADLLFKVASDWLYERGVTEIYGPMSPNMMGEIGTLVDGFERTPMFLMPYNKPYYDKIITAAGFEKHVDLLAYGLNKNTAELARAEKAETLVLRRYPTLTVRKVNLSKWKQEVAIIGDIFNKAWAKNWGFAPFTHEEFEFLVGDMRYILEQDLALVVEDQGVPVAFSVGLPDINLILKKVGNGKLLPTGWYKLLTGIKKIRVMRLLLMGIIPEYQGKGVDALMNLHSIRNGLALGYEEAEFSWLLENNTSVINLAERFGAKLTKRYRMYKKQ
jgi:GNAT superfamily N-acetyltransferase